MTIHSCLKILLHLINQQAIAQSEHCLVLAGEIPSGFSRQNTNNAPQMSVPAAQTASLVALCLSIGNLLDMKELFWGVNVLARRSRPRSCVVID